MDLVDDNEVSKPGRRSPLRLLFDELEYWKNRIEKIAITGGGQSEEIRIKTKTLIGLLEQCLKIDDFLKTKQMTISEIFIWAKSIMKETSIVTLRDTGEMWIYDPHFKKYIPHAETYIESLCTNPKIGGERASTPVVLKTLLLNIRGDTYKSRKDFEPPEGLINMNNGVYSLEDGGLYENDPKYNFTYVLPYDYDPSAKCPVYMKVVNNLFPNEEDRITIQRWLGYQFMKGYPFQQYLHLCGPSGAGKSTLMYGFYTVIGQENYTSYSMQDFLDRNTYATAQIYRKLANICADMSTASVKGDISVIKKLVSTVDVISARDIYKRPFQFVNSCKLTFISNKMPFVKMSILRDDAIKRRVMVIKVEKANFEANDEIFKSIENEASGIFNWAIEGYLDLINKRTFGYNKDSTFIWAQETDPGEDKDSDENILEMNFK